MVFFTVLHFAICFFFVSISLHNFLIKSYSTFFYFFCKYKTHKKLLNLRIIKFIFNQSKSYGLLKVFFYLSFSFSRCISQTVTMTAMVNLSVVAKTTQPQPFFLPTNYKKKMHMPDNETTKTIPLWNIKLEEWV